uniref:hypothetical protein n=1 Tax=Campylobacter insulaenigrae TaxID=260714 RepID=UPI00242C3A7E
IELNTQNKTLNETEKDTKTIFKISRNINEKIFLQALFDKNTIKEFMIHTNNTNFKGKKNA